MEHSLNGLACVHPMEMRVTEVTLQRCRSHVRKRPVEAHKGTMGHALLVAGSPGMAGAAVLASRACMRSGVGKCTVCTPRSNNDILQISVPEVIVAGYGGLANPAENRRARWQGETREIDEARWRGETEAARWQGETEAARCQGETEGEAERWLLDFGAYDGVGIGPGLGQSQSSEYVLRTVLSGITGSAVVDADAINLIGKGVVPIRELPTGLIFTPHKKEFERLLGAVQSERAAGRHPCGEPQGTVAGDDVTRAVALAMEVKGYVLLKGHRSALCCHDGEVIYNTTGNAGMATAGSGDVLTGIITGLLTRGYEPKVAAMMGMYLHGLAGDMAADEVGQESLIASDIIRWLPKAMGRLYC